MGSAKYFGQDTAPFCKDLERSIELFANFKPETPYHPNWGKERAEQVLENLQQNNLGDKTIISCRKQLKKYYSYHSYRLCCLYHRQHYGRRI